MNRAQVLAEIEKAKQATPGPFIVDEIGVYSDDSTGSIVGRFGGRGFEYVSRNEAEITANAELFASAGTHYLAVLQQLDEHMQILKELRHPSADPYFAKD